MLAHQGHLIAANVGDSRAVIFQFNGIVGSELRPVAITRDHTPNLESEKNRIISSGGEIRKMNSKWIRCVVTQEVCSENPSGLCASEKKAVTSLV